MVGARVSNGGRKRDRRHRAVLYTETGEVVVCPRCAKHPRFPRKGLPREHPTRESGWMFCSGCGFEWWPG